MSTRQDRVAPALLLLAFGLAPWIDAGAYALARAAIGRLSGSDADAVTAAVGVSIAIGLVAVAVALTVGAIAVMRTRRDARQVADSRDDGPLPSRGVSRLSTTIARGASLIAVVTLWGPFGAGVLDSMLADHYLFFGPKRIESQLFAAGTVAATLAGAIMLFRSRRHRSS